MAVNWRGGRAVSPLNLLAQGDWNRNGEIFENASFAFLALWEVFAYVG